MSLHEIIERFTLVSGLEMQDVSRYLTLISDCKALFDDMIDLELNGSERRRLAHACAVYAYYRISCMARDGGLQSFKAGDVQIVTDDDCAAALRLWESERALIADIISFDDDFAFRSVMI